MQRGSDSKSGATPARFVGPQTRFPSERLLPIGRPQMKEVRTVLCGLQCREEEIRSRARPRLDSMANRHAFLTNAFSRSDTHK
ncbi:hypothetical protein [Spirosoma aerophilum]